MLFTHIAALCALFSLSLANASCGVVYRNVPQPNCCKPTISATSTQRLARKIGSARGWTSTTTSAPSPFASSVRVNMVATSSASSFATMTRSKIRSRTRRRAGLAFTWLSTFLDISTPAPSRAIG
ncbi:hypothetical protein IWX91DRAFT_202522 [Phyllosticta citricarpa]